MATTEDIVRRDYAEAILIEPCMQRAGFDYDVPWRDLTRTHSEGWNETGIRLFTVSLASVWGYEQPPNPEPTLGAWLAFGEGLGTLSSEGLSQLRACIEQARQDLPTLDNEHNYAAALAFIAYDEAGRDAAVATAADEWMDCMAHLGIADLPASPTAMPSTSLIQRFGAHPGSPASAEEARIAVTDAQCRESSGFRHAYYIALWEAQVDQLAPNIDALTRNLIQIEAVRERMDSILTESAGRT